MIQIIGIVEVIIFYTVYFFKLFSQKRKGVRTNQMGLGNKTSKTIMIEKLLKFSSACIVAVILLSAIFNTFMVSSDIARVIGLLLFGIGTLLFIIAMFTMKDSWRAGIPSEEKTAFVTRGIYQYSRNPAFLGFDLTYIGAILAFGNIILLILAVFTITMMHLQILEEEHFLETRFGNDYTIYKSKVRRYI